MSWNLPLLDVVQSRKRKRVDTEEVPDPELAKRLKKSEKKRRKRERRAARYQLSDSNPNTPALHSPGTPSNDNPQPGPSHPSPNFLSRGPVLQDAPLSITKPQPECLTPETLVSTSSHGSQCKQDQNETGPREEALGLNRQYLLSPSPNSQIPLSTSVPSIPVHDPPPPSIHGDALHGLPDQGALPTTFFFGLLSHLNFSLYYSCQCHQHNNFSIITHKLYSS